MGWPNVETRDRMESKDVDPQLNLNGGGRKGLLGLA